MQLGHEYGGPKVCPNIPGVFPSMKLYGTGSDPTLPRHPHLRWPVFRHARLSRRFSRQRSASRVVADHRRRFLRHNLNMTYREAIVDLP